MKTLLFSLTKKDFVVTTFRWTGKGGQKRNKTSSGVRISHEESGAVASSDETRSQHKNKEIAFSKLIKTSKFEAWHKFECAKRMGVLDEIEKKVDSQMKDVLIEGKIDGLWAKI